jgi:MarC family membrane protein
MTWNRFIGITLLLYGFINPTGVIPIYLSLVRKGESVRAHQIIVTACSAVASLLVVAALFGKHILAFFNVGLDDFRIAGGLLALFIAFEMFQARYGGFIQTLEERVEAEAEIHGVAITPLAFPLLEGLAEMSIVITLSNDLPRVMDNLLLVAAATLSTVLVAATLWLAIPINRVLGTTGINVATRVMALIVASAGINFILTGIKDQLPGLVR